MSAFRNLSKPRSLRILLIASLVFAVVSGNDWYQEYRDVAGAEEVKAVILEASLTEFRSGSEQTSDRSFRPEIRFRYMADGLPRESVQVTPSDRSGDRAWAEDILQRFRPGTSTTCWLPRDPEKSAFLVPEQDWKAAVGTMAGLFVAALSGFFLWRNRGCAPEITAS